MFSNGVIGFLDPTQEPNQGYYGFCCEGYDNTADRPASKFTLMPFQTDLINYGDGKFMTRGDEESMTYGWYGISEYSRPNSSNNFEAEIYDDGMYQFRYGNLDVNRRLTIGSTGDPSADEYEQFLYGTLPPNGVETITSYGLGGQCVVDPLTDPNCPGYADAYAQLQFEQNCFANPLYDSACPGYQEAYFVQQCSIDPLYDQQCFGYEEAVFEQQCNEDPLSDELCPGYEQAFFDYQCEQNTLYDSGCPGYEQAFFDYQCSQNTLYDDGCPGYAQAFFLEQCSVDPLYDSDCEGYSEAFLEQQCDRDSTYSASCEGYSDAVEERGSRPSTSSTSPPSVESITEPRVTGDATVDEVLRGSSSSNRSSIQQSRPAPRPTPQAEPVPTPRVEPAPVNNREREETRSESRDSEKKETDIKENTEKRSERRKKLKEIAEAEARSLASDMGRSASIEQQQAVQARVLSLISYVPDFASYAQRGIPQPTDYYRSRSIYDDLEVPDSNFGARNGLAQEILHRRMVDMQYNNREEETN